MVAFHMVEFVSILVNNILEKVQELCELAAYQVENTDKLCIYVDAEHALDIKFQTLMNNVDLDKLFYFFLHQLVCLVSRF